jgi:hypothetical protein
MKNKWKKIIDNEAYLALFIVVQVLVVLTILDLIREFLL